MAAALFVALASGCGGDGDNAASRPTAPTAAEVATTQPNPTPAETGSSSLQPTETPERERPLATPVPTSGADEATPVPTSGAGLVLPVTGWEAVANGTNLWALELVSSGGEFFVTGGERGPGVEPRSGVWRSADGVSWDESLVFSSDNPADPRIDVGDLTVVDGQIVGLAQRTDGADWPLADNKELVAFSTDDQGSSWSESVVHTWGAANLRDLAVAPTFAYGSPDVVFAVEGGAGEGGGDDKITGTMVWIRDGDGWEFIDPARSGLAQVWVWAMAATGDGFVALGDTRETVEGFADCQTQALWTSPDARSWTKVWTNNRDCEWFSIKQLITIDGDLLGVGNENDVISVAVNEDGAGEAPALDAPVRVFRITDQAIEDRPIEGTEFTDMFLTDVEISDDGVIVAIGRTFDFSESGIWLSADAHTWTRADISADDLANKELFQVATDADTGTTIILGTEILPGIGPTNFHTWINTSS